MGLIEKIKNFRMEKPIGITFSCGFSEWFKPKAILRKQEPGNVRPKIPNTNGELENVKIAGFKIDIGIGTWRRPIPKFWKRDFWSSDYRIKSQYNPWNSGNHWFVLTIPIMPYIFVCCILGSFGKYHPGFYFGGRTAEVNNWTHWKIDYRTINEDGSFPGKYEDIPWERNEKGEMVLAWGTWDEEENYYVEPTLSIRDDMLYS